MAMRSRLPLLVLLLGLVWDVGSHGSSMEGDSSSRYLKHPTGYPNIDKLSNHIFMLGINYPRLICLA